MNLRPPTVLGALTISRADQSTGRQQPARKRLAAQFATSGLQWDGSDPCSDTRSRTNRRRRMAWDVLTISSADESAAPEDPARKRLAALSATSGLQWAGRHLCWGTRSQTNRRRPTAWDVLTISRADQSTGRQQPARMRLAAQFATSGLQWGGSDLPSDTPFQTKWTLPAAVAQATLNMEVLTGLHRVEQFPLRQ